MHTKDKMVNLILDASQYDVPYQIKVVLMRTGRIDQSQLPSFLVPTFSLAPYKIKVKARSVHTIASANRIGGKTRNGPGRNSIVDVP